MAVIPEGVARYRAAELIKRHPCLSNLLFKLQAEGADWDTLLKKLEQALEASQRTQRPEA